MSKENEEFLSLYRTYENQLRARGVEYREVEEKTNSDRMRMMRQMRNYLVHVDDPGFVTISSTCLKALKQMIKEESLKGDLVKNHLITPAKGSAKEGTPLSKVIYRMVMMGKASIPVFDEAKHLKGILMLENAAYALDKLGNVPLTEAICGPYSDTYLLVSPDTPTDIKTDDKYVCCTKDGTLETQYMGYLDV